MQRDKGITGSEYVQKVIMMIIMLIFFDHILHNQA